MARGIIQVVHLPVPPILENRISQECLQWISMNLAPTSTWTQLIRFWWSKIKGQGPGDLMSHSREWYIRRMNKDAGGVIHAAVKHSGGKVMIWGCSGHGNMGELYRLGGILKKDGYDSILPCHAIPWSRCLIRASGILQQYNIQSTTGPQLYWAVVEAAWPFVEKNTSTNWQ